MPSASIGRLSPTGDTSGGPLSVGFSLPEVNLNYHAVVNGVQTLLSSAFVYDMFRDAIYKAAATSGTLPPGELQLWYGKKSGGDSLIWDSNNYSTFLRQLASQDIRKDNGNVIFWLLPAARWELSPGHTDDEQENVLQSTVERGTEWPKSSKNTRNNKKNPERLRPANTSTVPDVPKTRRTTRRIVRPSRKAKEIADAEKEMQSKGKKKGVSARDARFARNFALDED